MTRTVLQIENVSKIYRLGQIGTGTLMDDVNRWVKLKMGKPDPYLKIGEENDRTQKGGRYAWALKDINLNIEAGEILGVIGRNGAGKSTLLKLLSRVTSPTTGTIKVKGKMASLLEVGTGFHPELTGRENVFLNAAILGMNKAEVESKLQAIVEFSGVAKYIDTPVKRYSSGMKVRLGFAVAAYLEPDILIVDEVLAVGDAEFQSKAIGKMQEVSQGQGRTVIFVSHNMASIRKLCNKAIVMDKGKITFCGNVNEAINAYFNQFAVSNGISSNHVVFDRHASMAELNLISASITTEKLDKSVIFPSSDDVMVEVIYEVKTQILGMRMNFQIQAADATVLYAFSSHDIEPPLKPVGVYNLKFTLPKETLNEGMYYICIQAGIPNERELLPIQRILAFEIIKTSPTGSRLNEKFPGYFSVGININISKT